MKSSEGEKQEWIKETRETELEEQQKTRLAKKKYRAWRVTCKREMAG